MALEETVITQSLFLDKFQPPFERLALKTVAPWEDMITFPHYALNLGFLWHTINPEVESWLGILRPFQFNSI